ncbi:hypothetical protein TWF594_005048 [Orbilia oligospora]|nr:hypothetical protein TWF706_007737 [Orbilia oligospora]KAF3143491.1 hypothetical protein TWF594_005048 [Orbilia oligospora]
MLPCGTVLISLPPPDEDPDDDARDVFAFGSIIVKSSHLKSTLPMRQYSLSDENELAATKVVRGAFNRMGIEVPEILFAGKIVGIIDWEIGLKRACAVHQQYRTPKREDFANLNLEEEHLADLTYWYDLYQLD